MNRNRWLQSVPSRMLAVSLLGLLSIPMSAFAETTPSKTTTTKSKAQTVQPVLDDATRKTIEEAALKLDRDTRRTMNTLSQDIQLQDKTLNNELRDEEELSMTDIGMLWEAAVERSGTIRYAIEKLSRRDATGKPVAGDSFSKRMIGNLVNLGGVAGSMWTGTPAGLIGSNMVQQLMSGSPDDAALSQVTDADMVILAKEVEALQSDLIQRYYNYRHAKEKLELAQEANSTILKYYDHSEQLAGKNTETIQPLLQSIVESSRQDLQNAQQTFNSSRSALSLMVGPEAVAALEQSENTQAAKNKASASRG